MKKTPLKKVSVLNSSKLRKECVKIAKIIVKHEAHYTCDKCGRTAEQVQQQGAHIFPEGRYQSMSADLDNILCLCAGCHMWSADSWHESPLQAAEWFHNKYPDRYEKLKKRAQQSVKMGKYEWNNKLAALKDKLREILH